jgi:sugar O-acyltransferase (sialic acid O-acetyltransferase NeuD family)
LDIGLREADMEKIIVIGTGGLAREFSAFFSNVVEIVGFSSTDKKEHQKFSLPGKFFNDALRPSTVGTDKCVIANGNPVTKERISKELGAKGFQFPNLIHPSVVLASKIADSKSRGIIISPNCTIGSEVTFGDHVYLNFMVGVGHDCKFDGYIQINPGVQIGGFAHIKSHVLIGSNSTIRQGLIVESSATVGSGSVVLTRVRGGITVLGNPARKLKLPGA